MSHSFRISTNPLIAKTHQLYSRDLALENDFLREENYFIRSQLPRRVILTEADRHVLVRYASPSRIASQRSFPSPSLKLSWLGTGARNKRSGPSPIVRQDLDAQANRLIPRP
jgi:hypothetical protein